MKNLLKISALVMALSFGSSAFAATNITTNMQANATVSSSCLLSASNIAFGSFTPTATATNLTANGTISATCSNGVSYQLAIDAGLTGTIAARKMAPTGTVAGNSDTLSYNLYTDLAKTTIFGNGTSGSKVTVTGNGGSQSTTVYGNILTNQYITPDNYVDTLTVSMTY